MLKLGFKLCIQQRLEHVHFGKYKNKMHTCKHEIENDEQTCRKRAKPSSWESLRDFSDSALLPPPPPESPADASLLPSIATLSEKSKETNKLKFKKKCTA
jgi:hypothetical protein